MTTAEQNRCPVCGFLLEFAPWDGGSASDGICSCCGIQFGYDDFAAGDLERRLEVHEAWRQRWISGGMLWFSPGEKPPVGWDPLVQLEEIGIHVTVPGAD